MAKKPTLRTTLSVPRATLTKIVFAEIHAVADPFISSVEVGATIPITFTTEFVDVNNPMARHVHPDSFTLAPTPRDIVAMSLAAMLTQFLLTGIVVLITWLSVWKVLCSTHVAEPVTVCSTLGSGGRRRKPNVKYSRLEEGSQRLMARRSSIDDPMGVNNVVDLGRLTHIAHLLEAPPKPRFLAYLVGVGATGLCVILTVLILAANGNLFRARPESIVLLQAGVWLIGTLVGGIASVAAYSWWGGDDGDGSVSQLSNARFVIMHATIVPFVVYVSALVINVASGITVPFAVAFESLLVVLAGVLLAAVISFLSTNCASCCCAMLGTGPDRPGAPATRGMYSDAIAMQVITPTDAGGSRRSPHPPLSPPKDKRSDESGECEEVYVYEIEEFTAGGEDNGFVEQQEEDEDDTGRGIFDTRATQTTRRPDPFGLEESCLCGALSRANYSMHAIQFLGSCFFLLISIPTILATCRMQFAVYYSPIPGTLITAWIFLVINFSIWVSYVSFQWIRRNVMWWHWVPFTMGMTMTSFITITVVIFVASNSNGSMRFGDFVVLVSRLVFAGPLLACTIAMLASIPVSLLIYSVDRFTSAKVRHMD